MPGTDAKFDDPAVAEVFASYPPALAGKLLRLRALIFDTAERTAEVGPIVESLKWGQPSYVPAKPRTGSAIRLGLWGKQRDQFALYFHCQTSLVATFRIKHQDLNYQGNRAIVFRAGERLPLRALKECVRQALTYHLAPSR